MSKILRSFWVVSAWCYYLFAAIPLLGGVDTMARPQVHHLGLEQGLPNRIIHGSAYDEADLLWIATESGLCRYDGYAVTPFTAFPQRFRGRLWRGEGGHILSLSRDQPDSIEVFHPPTLSAHGIRLGKLARGQFAGATVSKNNRLYFAAGGFVYRYDERANTADQVHQLQRETAQGDQLVHADEEEYIIYRAADRSLVNQAGEQLPLPGSGTPHFLYRDRNETIWYNDQDGGFYQLPPQGTNFLAAPTLPSGDEVNFLNEDESGNLIIGHYRAFFRRFSSLLLLEPNGQQTNLGWILKNVEDRIISFGGKDYREEIRLNTYGGLSLLRADQEIRRVFRNYLYEDLGPGKFGHVMRGFAADDAGNVYVNKDSRQPWWFRIDAETLDLDTLTMLDNKGEPADQFGCGTNLLNYRGDIYGMSCYRGVTDTGHLYRYSPSTDIWKRWQLPKLDQVARWIIPGFKDGELLVFTQDAENNVRGLIYAFYPAEDRLEEIRLTGPELYLAGWAKTVVKDSVREAYWIGSTRGLYHFDYRTERLLRYQFADGKPTIISTIHLRRNGELMLGTFGSGLQHFDPVTERFLQTGGVIEEDAPTPDPDVWLVLPSNDVSGLVFAPSAGLLITTFNGLVYHGPNASAVFTSDDGLPGNEFNTPSLFQNPVDGRWYAGGVNGFTSFLTEELKPLTSTLAPALLRYRMLDRAVGHESVHPLRARKPGRLTIPATVSYFSLEFTIPDLFPPIECRYQTRLVGYDPDWRAATTTPSVRYTRLPPGNYTFQLKAIDGHGKEGNVIRELPITVLRPWYNQLWFYTLCIFLIALAIYAVMNTRLRRVRRAYEAKRKLQSLELRSLRQQINPHFLSNAMNAIRETISQQQTDKAAEYLLDFNRLMRLFLESSRNRFTPLEEEVEMLRKYVGLEQLRFPGRFTAHFDISPKLDDGMDEVPSLLLQPIVENAIIHGLAPLKEGGELRIRFELDEVEEETIICTISDNGLGRKLAAENADKRNGHISRASQILADRLKLLEQDPTLDLQISIDDLYPERKHTGTVVRIRIAG